jgi:hypothetical protein
MPFGIQDMFVIRADGSELISDKFPTQAIFARGQGLGRARSALPMSPTIE